MRLCASKISKSILSLALIEKSILRVNYMPVSSYGVHASILILALSSSQNVFAAELSVPAEKPEMLAQNQYQYPNQYPGQMPDSRLQQMPVQNQYPGQMPDPRLQQMPVQNQYPGQMPDSRLQQVPAPNQQVPAQDQNQLQTNNAAAQAPASGLQVPDRLIDLNSCKCSSLTFDIDSGQFMNANVNKLQVALLNLDTYQGLLGSLELILNGGQFESFFLDQLRMKTESVLSFSTESLLNKRSFDFRNPAIANVSAVISQNSLNRFISSPSTLQLLSNGAQNKLPSLLGELVGAALQLRVQQASLRLLPENRVQIDALANAAVLGSQNTIPVSILAKLALQDGWVSLTDTQILTAGQPIPQELSAALVKRVNGLAQWGNKNDDIQFRFTRLTVVPGDRFELSGQARIKRLRFGS